MQSGATLLEPVSWVSSGKEDSSRDTRSCGVKTEAHSCQQGLPARDASHLVLHTLLRCVHGIALAILYSLKRLLHLQRRASVLLCSSGCEFCRVSECVYVCPCLTRWSKTLKASRARSGYCRISARAWPMREEGLLSLTSLPINMYPGQKKKKSSLIFSSF